MIISTASIGSPNGCERPEALVLIRERTRMSAALLEQRDS
jgi:hypothetical protein